MRFDSRNNMKKRKLNNKPRRSARDIDAANANYQKISIFRYLSRTLNRAYLFFLLALFVCGAYLYIFHKNMVINFLTNQVSHYSKEINYTLNEVIISSEGDYCVDINSKVYLNKYQDTSIFLLPIDKIKKHLESIDCVEHALVKLELPNVLRIKLFNKKPLAIWQHNKNYSFITNKGDVIKIRKAQGLEKFIIVTGEDAPQKTLELLTILSSNESIYQQITAAMRVGGRRWNIKINNTTEILLPEEHPEIAWQKLVNLYESDKNFQDLKYKSIDFRIPGKIYTKN